MHWTLVVFIVAFLAAGTVARATGDEQTERLLPVFFGAMAAQVIGCAVLAPGLIRDVWKIVKPPALAEAIGRFGARLERRQACDVVRREMAAFGHPEVLSTDDDQLSAAAERLQTGVVTMRSHLRRGHTRPADAAGCWWHHGEAGMLTIYEAHTLALDRNRPDVAELVLLVSAIDDSQLVEESILDEPADTIASALAEAQRIAAGLPSMETVLNDLRTTLRGLHNG